ncbi:LOW QUALITY PROTEIN: lea domain-containing protein [Purpureocillium lavendulum]|uniref:Lea domain-containing protein n=1 Tax=Purpureocillium lavendulum TaxID=1247861 RepID=A0AB34FDQ5_9HYPO|nr:LOW QUALITY PROTEIN: lea domain-containing protein [Purpureocillium lavendulum]
MLILTIQSAYSHLNDDTKKQRRHQEAATTPRSSDDTKKQRRHQEAATTLDDTVKQQPAAAMAQTILVTGASGFIAAHVVEALLRKGYNVRGTVRSERSAAEVLQTHSKYARQMSTAIVPDIAAPNAFDEAVRGVDGIIHTASPFTLEVVDLEADLLQPAIRGTVSVLEAAQEHNPGISRVVITSSFASVIDPGQGMRPGYTYTEKDWNPVTRDAALASGDGVLGYLASKTLAEHAAWDYVKQNKPNFSVTTLLPPMVYGPVIHHVKNVKSLNTSSEDIYRLIDGSTKEVPDTSFWAYTDVRDLAEAHVLAFEKPEAAWQRYLIANASYSFQQVCDVIRDKFPQFRDVTPKGNTGAPLPPIYKLDTTKAVQQLGMKFRPLEDTVVNISKPPPPLPTARLSELRPRVRLLRPLSRRGHGPGLVVLAPDSDAAPLRIVEGVPSPVLKWAEEGYAVVEIQTSAVKQGAPREVLDAALQALAECDECDSSDKIGVVAYDLEAWNLVAPCISQLPSIVAGIVYADDKTAIEMAPVPVLQHLAGRPPGKPTPATTPPPSKSYYYPTATSARFAVPFQDDFSGNAESVAHSRGLSFLKPLVGGPHFDLEAIWDEHTYYEFADRSVEHTMSTMVQEPYVNHVPTLTGGIGRERLSVFYRDNFIFNNSADTELELISRTVGIDRVIDEFIFKFTHDQEIDWLLPGVPPTGLKAEVPFTAVVNVRGDRLYHEHISWDQGTVLRQLGLLPEYLPFPFPIPRDGDGGDDGGAAGGRAQFEYRVPVLGAETAAKMRDKNSVSSNGLIGGKVREA